MSESWGSAKPQRKRHLTDAQLSQIPLMPPIQDDEEVEGRAHREQSRLYIHEMLDSSPLDKEVLAVRDMFDEVPTRKVAPEPKRKSRLVRAAIVFFDVLLGLLSVAWEGIRFAVEEPIFWFTLVMTLVFLTVIQVAT